MGIKKLAPVVLVLMCAAQAFAQGPDREIWITIGADAVEPMRAEFRGIRAVEQPQVTDVENSVAVVRIRESQLHRVGKVMHDHFNRCAGFLVHEDRQEALNAARKWDAPSTQDVTVNYTIDNGPVVNALINELKATNIVNTITSLSSYYNRYYTAQTGVDAANWIKNTWQSYATGRSDVTVELFNHPTWAQPSVILTIQGTQQPSEVVVIGGHLDSINSSNSAGNAPGADDDASGVASFTEVVRAAMALNYRPAKTVKFMAYAAEEVGLRGSKEIANNYKANAVNVVGVLQLDMTNYKGSTVDVGLLTDNTNAAQNQFVTNLINTYGNGITWSNTSCGYGCSDHVSWHNNGYPASMPFEALMNQHNSRIHTTGDTLSNSDSTGGHALKFSKIAAMYVAELAKGVLGSGGPDVTPPTVSITAPASGSNVSGTVSVNANATDDVGVTKVEFFVDGVLRSTDTTAPHSYPWDTTTAANGSHTLTAKAYDAAGNSSTSAAVTVTVANNGAVYDATLKAPKCGTVSSVCDSGSLLNGRANLGPEPNQPNTINGSCADGASGTYHSDESNDRVKVYTVDGTNFAPGKQVRIEATVWAYSSFSADQLDLYYAADATNPSWTFLTTITPTAGGAQTLSATYTLPSGGTLQAVRARFRYQGSAAPCGTGSYDDHDDLIFAVGGGTPDTTPPTVSITSPASGSTVNGTVTLSASASDNVGVSKVEFYVDGTLLATDTTSPYSAGWNTTTATNGSHTLSARAYDAANNVGTSANVAVTVNNSSGTAVYDATLKAPKCAAVGISCDSGTLLNGRGPIGPEPNQPNTINNSCADGTSGTYHSDESNDRIKVSTVDGTSFAAGKQVRIEATVWAYSSFSSDKLDLYYAANANSPTWTYITTLTPTVGGAQTLSATYTLPTGTLQAVRARFRYGGSAAACGTGSYNDHDDLIFAVQ